MSAIDTLFAELRRSGRKALMPFITAGDPDLEFTAQVLQRLAARGCHLFELGFPYSDPIADGPVIQASYTRALERGIKVADILTMARRTLPKLGAPTVAMVSYAIVHRYGPERFVADAQAAGIAGAIVPDLLVEESDALAAVCRNADFNLVQLVTPTTPRERALQIAKKSSGFLYYVSVTGITGERRELPRELIDNVTWLRQQTPLPVCIGFGIGQAQHVKQLAPVADGLIVGSALVRRIAAASSHDREAVLRDVEEFAGQLLAAME
jgi:tryptophan synthase alpha chain